MKLLFLSLLVGVSSSVRAEVFNVIQKAVYSDKIFQNPQDLKSFLNNEITSEKVFFKKPSKSEKAKGYITKNYYDLGLSTQDDSELRNKDSQKGMNQEENKIKFLSIVKELALNEEKSKVSNENFIQVEGNAKVKTPTPSLDDDGNPKVETQTLGLANRDKSQDERQVLTQIEVNLLVKYFYEFDLDPQILISPAVKSSLKNELVKENKLGISGVSQVLQILDNIANLRLDMNNFLGLDIRCFFRNYGDPNAALKEAREFAAKLAKKGSGAVIISRSGDKLVINTAEGDPRLTSENFLYSEAATIVAKCRGFGLSNLPPRELISKD
jgi:hypothetical protein